MNTPLRTDPIASEHIGATAIRFLATHGYDNTTAGQLADAVGMSRSTFFRRFGSKDDAIFIDHDVALRALSSELELAETAAHDATPDDPAPEIAAVISRSTTAVFHHLTRDSEAALLRSGLLRETPALRDRELVITHRYERVFVKYLQHVVPEHTPAWVAHALGAGAVALHNATFRAWLRTPDPRIIAQLDADLVALVRQFDRWLRPNAAPQRVLVASYDVAAAPEALISAIRASLAEVPAATN